MRWLLQVAGCRPPQSPLQLAVRAAILVVWSLLLGRVLNRDSYPVLTLVDGGRAVALDMTLLDEQFPPRRS